MDYAIGQIKLEMSTGQDVYTKQTKMDRLSSSLAKEA